MTNTLSFFSNGWILNQDLIHAMVWTLIHSVWQGAAVSLCIALSYLLTKKYRASTRYWINTSGFIACIFLSIITFKVLDKKAETFEIIQQTNTLIINATAEPSSIEAFIHLLTQYQNIIFSIWLLGVALLLIKYLADIFYCQWLTKNRIQQPDKKYLRLLEDLKIKMGIQKNINLSISEIVKSPCTLGHFKPYILMPLAIVSGFTSQQIEMILLHELAHIKRADYLINGIQVLVARLYFFNPFIQWITTKMDEERENACDDMAVAICGDSLTYAKTLTEFAEMNTYQQSTLSMTGSKNLLGFRIKRLFNNNYSVVKAYGRAISLMSLILLLIGYSAMSHSTAEKQLIFPTVDLSAKDARIEILLQHVKAACPNELKNFTLDHPNSRVSIEALKQPCIAMKALFEELNQIDNSAAPPNTTPVTKEQMLIGEAISSQIKYPIQLLEKGTGITAKCSLSLTINTEGKAYSITPECTANDSAANEMFNDALRQAANLSDFKDVGSGSYKVNIEFKVSDTYRKGTTQIKVSTEPLQSNGVTNH